MRIVALTSTARMIPCASATAMSPDSIPVAFAETMAAPPTNTSAKVPTNSATKWRRLSRMGAGKREMGSGNRVGVRADSVGLALICPLQYKGCVDSSKAKRIGQGEVHAFLPTNLRDVIEIAPVAGFVQVQGRRQPAPIERQRRDRDLERAGRAQRVAVVPLGAADLQVFRVVAEHLADGGGFRGIVEWRRAAVRVHIAHVRRVDVPIAERESHGARCLRRVRTWRSHVVRVV